MAEAHVLIFPLPLPGHLGSMLKLAELLALDNIHVTFVDTENIHIRLTRFGDIQELSECYPTLHFKTIPDCYDEEGEHPGFGDRVGDFITSTAQHAKPFLRDILLSQHSPGIPKVSCIIQDGIFGALSSDFAAELRIPLIHFRTVSSCCFWAYFCVPKLLDCKELPIKGMEYSDSIFIASSHSTYAIFKSVLFILYMFQPLLLRNYRIQNKIFFSRKLYSFLINFPPNYSNYLYIYSIESISEDVINLYGSFNYWSLSHCDFVPWANMVNAILIAAVCGC